MAKAKPHKHEISIRGTAKAEAVAKATFERKKSITEVIPPDVTRAKAGRWLDLISPITEWAGLKGDALRYKRRQLRIQQESSLERLAEAIRNNIRGQEILHPLPPKILVPALEGASLEDSNSPLINWWAELLSKGVRTGEIRPFLVDLMTKIGNEEATLLDEFWSRFALAENGLWKRLSVDEHGRPKKQNATAVRSYFKGYIEATIEKVEKRGTMTKAQFRDYFLKAAGQTASYGDECGVGIEVSVGTSGDREFFTSKLLEQGSSLNVCESLHLIEQHNDYYVVHAPHPVTLDVNLLYFSDLGIEFMTACRPGSEERASQA